MIAFAWLIVAYRGTPAHVLWIAPQSLKLAILPIQLFAFVLLIAGITTPNPVIVGSAHLFDLEQGELVRGILRVTRNAFFWGVGLWGLAHVVASGELAGVVMFGTIAALGLIGAPLLDAKKKALYGARWDAFSEVTSSLPFLAIAQGRQRLAGIALLRCHTSESCLVFFGDRRNTVRLRLAWFLGLLSVANGVFMMVAPAAWYPLLPGVVASGPFNDHFIRDIGAAFVIAGIGFLWFANDSRARPAALAAAAFFGLHALIHISDTLAGRENLHYVALDIPTIYLSALLAPWVVWPQSLSTPDFPMLRWLLRRRMEAFEKSYDYDLSYVREIMEVSPRAALKLGRVGGFGNYCEDVPREAIFAARLAGTMAEDCGPCTQLVATMAEREGVPPSTIRSILAGDERTMTSDAALGFRFAQAVLQHDAAADSVRKEIISRWGRRALVSLAFGITAARLYPTLKYALGHGRTCVQVRVGGTSTAVKRRQAA